MKVDVDILSFIVGGQVLKFNMISHSLIYHLQKEIIFMSLFSSIKVTKLHLTSYMSPSMILSQLDIAVPKYFNIVQAIQNMVSNISMNRGSEARGWFIHSNKNITLI